jgi:hypothetical protein
MHFFKNYLNLFFFLIAGVAFSQQSELLIPKDAVTVFSINNISLLQKISMDDLVKYDFMEEVHQELFDGSTSGKTLKDAGIDFDQKLNLFYGKVDKSEISGFTFGVKNKVELFKVFDDFQELPKMSNSKISVYGTFFNNLIIKNNSALLIRVEPTMEYIDRITDSIWYARGNENPFYNEYGNPEGDGGVLEEEIYDEEGNVLEEGYTWYPEASDDPNVKNYYELRDSVQLVLQQEQLAGIMKELFENDINLVSSDGRFKDLMSHNSEGVFYMDNARNIDKAAGLWYFQTVLPSLYKDIQELYHGNLITGDMFLKDKMVEFKMTANYGPGLGEIYYSMNDARFNKKMLNYIPASSTGYFTYNVDLRKAYETAYQVIMPILSQEKNAQIAMNVLTIELLNEFVNKDALFGTYQGGIFGNFNGFKKIKTKKIEFFYDEETFEYGERVAEAEEDMPVFTVGFSIKRSDIPEKVLKHLGRLTSKVRNEGDYWVFENAILDAAPLYMINKKGIFILTNDGEVAFNYTNGYGKERLGRKERRRVKKSGFMYANVDIAETLTKFPMGVLNPRQGEMVESLKGKSGNLELVSSKTSKKKTDFTIQYTYDGVDPTGKHLLDLINTIYIVGK